LISKTTVNLAEASRSALVVAGVLALLAGWSLYRERETVAVMLAGVSAALAVIGFFVPVGAQAFHKAWMGLAHLLGWVNSRILLAVVFYGIVTPVGLVQRLLGRNMLNRRGVGSESYWVPRRSKRQSPEQFERLF
jgi:hypothetical protein